MAEEMKHMDGPYEILELIDGQTYQLRITGWQAGTVTIYPAHKPTGKVITALRVHVPQESKPYFPHYWDITSQTLVAQLMPYLERAGYKDQVFTITKHGVAPKARFSLDVRPA